MNFDFAKLKILGKKKYLLEVGFRSDLASQSIALLLNIAYEESEFYDGAVLSAKASKQRVRVLVVSIKSCYGLYLPEGHDSRDISFLFWRALLWARHRGPSGELKSVSLRCRIFLQRSSDCHLFMLYLTPLHMGSRPKASSGWL
jgi:hypothetical protein